MALPSTKIMFRDHFTMDTFAILLLQSGLGLTKIPKSAFLRYFCFRHIFIKIPYCNAQKLPPPEGKELQRLKRQFRNWHVQGNNLGGCRVLGCHKGANKNRLTRPSSSSWRSCTKKRLSTVIKKMLEMEDTA